MNPALLAAAGMALAYGLATVLQSAADPMEGAHRCPPR
jgi:hypothetical protein